MCFSFAEKNQLMQNKILFIVPAFVLLTHWSFSQEHCSHIEKSSLPSELVSYLFSQYGQENSEQILLKIQAYEKANDKKVLASEAYAILIEKLDAEIAGCTDPQRVQELQERKKIFIPLTEIEQYIR